MLYQYAQTTNFLIIYSTAGDEIERYLYLGAYQ